MENKRNFKYFVISVAFAAFLIITGAFGIFYFILFIHSNSLCFQITSFAIAALGIYILYHRRHKIENSKKVGK
jgi:fatty-acid desaturase